MTGSLDRTIDRLLQPWATKDGPGVTIGIVQDGALTAHRSAGLASIEHRVPIGPATRFRVASVTKQFTCAAILMLEHEGRLSLEDPAQAHLPELPHPEITVAQLMHNTSGIRDMLEIMRQGGADLGTPVTSQALLDGICRQRSLNFAPGTRFLYSNANFLLLGLIAERIEGRPLPDILHDRIFAPLGMASSVLTPDTLAVVPDLATGYMAAAPGTWRRAPHAFPLHGEGGLVSTVADLLRWDRRLDEDDWLPRALAQQTPFLNGTPNRYARGQVVQSFRGQPTVSHGGLWPGYRTEFLRAPSHRTTVVVISNDAGAVPTALAHAALSAILEGRPGVHPVPKLPPPEALAAMVGRFLDPASSTTLDIALPEDGHPTMALNGLVMRAEPTEDGALASPRSSSVFTVRPAPGGVHVEQDAGTAGLWHRLPPEGTVPLPEGLEGTWHSPEMAAAWTIAATPDGLAAHATGPVTAGPPWRIEPMAPDQVRVHVPGTLFPAWLDVRVLREAGQATALIASGGRARNVRYEAMSRRQNP